MLQKIMFTLLGVVRSYDLTISRGYIAPDGVNKSVILINNQFPGVSHLKWIHRLPTDRFVANVRSELGM